MFCIKKLIIRIGSRGNVGWEVLNLQVDQQAGDPEGTDVPV